MPKPRKIIKSFKQLEELDIKALPNKPEWMDREEGDVDMDEEPIERDLVDIMRGKQEGD
jgi:hypothetical protein